MSTSVAWTVSAGKKSAGGPASLRALDLDPDLRPAALNHHRALRHGEPHRHSRCARVHDVPSCARAHARADLKGKPLIQRSYRDDVPGACIERFMPIVLDIEEEGQQLTPCFTREGVNYIHIRHSNLYRAPPPTRLALPGAHG
jgi:hypothetical protein